MVLCWWKQLSGALASLRYASSYYYLSFYTLSNKKEKSIIWVQLDDGIVTGSSEMALKLLEQQLKGSLKIKWEEGLTSMVGMNIRQSEAVLIDLTQPNLINKILQNRWERSSVAPTPLLEGFAEFLLEDGKGVNPTDYLYTIGVLSNVAVGTHPDIAYSNYLEIFSSLPLAEHWKGLKHLSS